MRDLIRRIIRETVTDKEVICDKCGWSWDIADGGDDLYICHKCGHDNSKFIKEDIDTENSSKFTYITLKPYDNYKVKRYYFNNVVRIPGVNPNSDTVKLSGNEGDFEFSKNLLFYNEEKRTIYINKSDFDEKYPLYKKVKNSENIGINSNNIKKALELSFPQNWGKGDKIFTPGLRGVYTIGSKTGDNEETWSIMNYFDTKEEIHDLLYLKYKEDETDENIVDWMVNIFKNDNEFTKLLVDRQWQSIESGLKLERESVDSFFDILHPSDVIYYPHGSIMDRWNGVDVTVDGFNYQIKPLKSYSINDTGEYVVNTYGMRDYTQKNKVDFIAYANKNEVLIFENKDYILVSRYKVIHKLPPLDNIYD